MAEITQPYEIARETLRRLATQRTPPTPDNYRTLYDEIAGTMPSETFPERSFKALSGRLPRATSVQGRFVQQLDASIATKDWAALTTALHALLKEFESEPPAWRTLIGDLLGQIERRHAGLTPAKKREALDHILESCGTDPAMLFERMSALLRSWSKGPSSEASALTADVATEPAVTGDQAKTHAKVAAPSRHIESGGSGPFAVLPGEDLRELIALLAESSMSLLVADTPALAQEASAIANDLRGASNAASFAAIAKRVKQYSYRLNFVAEDQAELKAALQKLLQLVIENITELVDDDKWLQGQISLVLDLVAQPLNVRQLHDVERRLKEVIYKQSMLKQSLTEAKARLKLMLASFVDHLASFSESTSDYHDKINRCAQKISSASGLGELNDVIEDVMRETRVIQINAQRSRDDLGILKGRVDEAEREVTRLQNELAHTSDMVRHDSLTGALNRKGLDEALDRELARARRRNAPLCIALLDVDNFKQINDHHGHQVGDDALVHLARVIREALRPNDTLARYGGEEFLVLLPDTEQDDAVTALVRLQRELTKKFFMTNNEKLLVTFSAGVTAVRDNENSKATIVRADGAMYQAKKAGKNRVVAAE